MFVGWADWVDCRCFLSFVFLGVARRLEISPCTTLGNDMFVVSVWHRLGHHVPADVAPPPCKCRVGAAAEAHHGMVCKKVAKMTQMRHDNLANALSLVVSACSCQSAAEPRYRALAGKKGMVECQRRGDIVAVLLRLELAAVDVVVAHASAK